MSKIKFPSQNKKKILCKFHFGPVFTTLTGTSRMQQQKVFTKQQSGLSFKSDSCSLLFDVFVYIGLSTFDFSSVLPLDMFALKSKSNNIKNLDSLKKLTW